MSTQEKAKQIETDYQLKVINVSGEKIVAKDHSGYTVTFEKIGDEKTTRDTRVG